MTSSLDVDAVAELAREIWSEHYTPIIGRAQVEYMLDRFQSESAIARQLREDGLEYHLVLVRGRPVGYFALLTDAQSGSTQLSKIYLRDRLRGQGLGRALLRIVEERCASLESSKLWLTVNKRNVTALAFYQRSGFAVEASVVVDIGGGFVMDDYRLSKWIGRDRPA